MPGITTYPVKLVVTNLFGCKDSVTQTVTVRNVPDAAVGNADAAISFGTFNGVPTFRRCATIPTYTFSFVNQSTTTGINTSYNISWGDGTPDTTFTAWLSRCSYKTYFPHRQQLHDGERYRGRWMYRHKEIYRLLSVLPPPADYRASAILISALPIHCGLLLTIFRPTHREHYIHSLLMMAQNHRYFQHPPPSVAAHFFKQGSCSFTSSSGNNTFSNSFGAYLTIENPCGTTSQSVVPLFMYRANPGPLSM